MASEIASALFCHDGGGDVALLGETFYFTTAHVVSCLLGSVSPPASPHSLCLSRQRIGAKPTHASVLLSSPTQGNGSALYLM